MPASVRYTPSLIMLGCNVHESNQSTDTAKLAFTRYE